MEKQSTKSRNCLVEYCHSFNVEYMDIDMLKEVNVVLDKSTFMINSNTPK